MWNDRERRTINKLRAKGCEVAEKNKGDPQFAEFLVNIYELVNAHNTYFLPIRSGKKRPMTSWGGLNKYMNYPRWPFEAIIGALHGMDGPEEKAAVGVLMEPTDMMVLDFDHFIDANGVKEPNINHENILPVTQKFGVKHIIGLLQSRSGGIHVYFKKPTNQRLTRKSWYDPVGRTKGDLISGTGYANIYSDGTDKVYKDTAELKRITMEAKNMGQWALPGEAADFLSSNTARHAVVQVAKTRPVLGRVDFGELPGPKYEGDVGDLSGVVVLRNETLYLSAQAFARSWGGKDSDCLGAAVDEYLTPYLEINDEAARDARATIGSGVSSGLVHRLQRRQRKFKLMEPHLYSVGPVTKEVKEARRMKQELQTQHDMTLKGGI